MHVLISPTSVEEAMSIINCDLDILDVKNVNEGSLGAQFPWKTKVVVEAANARGIKISATLGDLPFKPGTGALAAYGCAALGVQYIKAGLHGCKTYQEAYEMMDAICRSVRMVSDTADVVAAAYADYRRFDGLNPMDAVKATRDSRSTVVMVDTAIKDGKTLFDVMSVQEIKDFVNASKDAGLKVALAGSIKFEHADLLFDIDPHIVGVRGAVCAGPTRASAICPNKTAEFMNLFRSRVAA